MTHSRKHQSAVPVSRLKLARFSTPGTEKLSQGRICMVSALMSSQSVHRSAERYWDVVMKRWGCSPHRG